jgi:hypothetical protein
VIPVNRRTYRIDGNKVCSRFPRIFHRSHLSKLLICIMFNSTFRYLDPSLLSIHYCLLFLQQILGTEMGRGGERRRWEKALWTRKKSPDQSWAGARHGHRQLWPDTASHRLRICSPLPWATPTTKRDARSSAARRRRSRGAQQAVGSIGGRFCTAGSTCRSTHSSRHPESNQPPTKSSPVVPRRPRAATDLLSCLQYSAAAEVGRERYTDTHPSASAPIAIFSRLICACTRPHGNRLMEAVRGIRSRWV